MYVLGCLALKQEHFDLVDGVSNIFMSEKIVELNIFVHDLHTNIKKGTTFTIPFTFMLRRC